ncbi:hypothetical protein, partial [Burkholderia sp. Se-20373]|uniref:hypothetical protein n=1 Tax=Burkholderia sp. Se-20373 TaxID=2703898 RepID=UPI00197F8CCD
AGRAPRTLHRSVCANGCMVHDGRLNSNTCSFASAMTHRGKPATVSRTRCAAGPAIMASTRFFRRAVRDAARHGFDRFAWNPVRSMEPASVLAHPRRPT